MKRLYYLLFLLFLAPAIQAQNCANLFGVGTYTVTVVCDQSGVAQYPLTFAQINSTSFTIAGLRNESTSSVTATCQDSTFTFPLTQFPSGNWVVGRGTYTGTGPINIAYGVYNPNMVQIDSCVGTYTAPVGVTNPGPAFSVSLSPNPAQDEVQVSVWGSSTVGDYSYEVFDMQGKRVFAGNFSSDATHVLSLSALQAGMYKLVVTNAEGRVVKALVKQ